MKKMMKLAAFACAGILMLTGCSMNNEENDKANNGTANESTTNSPQKGDTSANADSIDHMMNYLNGQGIRVSDMKPIEKMDFAAHEGTMFTYNGNTGYLYRLKSDDESMKALLDNAKKNGTAKVNIDGSEQEYSATVNGDYLFVYNKDADMNDFVTAMGSYVPGATTTTPNVGGTTKTTPTNGTAQDPTDPQAPNNNSSTSETQNTAPEAQD